MRFEAERIQHERRSDRLSLVRLTTFLAAGVLISAGIASANAATTVAGAFGALAFVAAVVAHRRVIAAMEGARVRRDIHDRHVQRIRGVLDGLPTGEGLVPEGHPYALDLDLVGEGSLFQRLDVTHTVHGERALAAWLGRAAERTLIERRQLAVAELSRAIELRQEIEAAALLVREHEKLDGGPFLELTQLPRYFRAHRGVEIASYVLPPTTLALYVLGQAAILPAQTWLLGLAAQVGVLIATAGPVKRAFDLFAARLGTAEAFERLFEVIERARFESPLLGEIQARLAVSGTPPSAHMRRLKTWASCAELRQQFLFYIAVNPLTLWDLHVLRGLERWNREVGLKTADWFEAIGELEALCSLATLLAGDPNASLPHISDGTLEARGLAHPLLPPTQRVANDVRVQGPSCALLVTGSNMAGKSTLLRAVGLNVALALAGGPVCAKEMRVPLVRLRASMRATDSLKRGASYFHAELDKLRSVVANAVDQPPVLFLLDELLRGTNERARHVGAKAVLLHLLDRGALGLVATHDVALCALAEQRPGHVHNVHFTDVLVDGEMRFDYRLREGVVRTSNALRLLALAGIEVAPAEREAIEPSEVHSKDQAKPSTTREPV